MDFRFESLKDCNLINGSSYFMDFGVMETEEDAAIVQGKLLTVFGEPASTSENYEDSFDYVIRATAEDGRSVILSVYNVGMVHIGAIQQDDFAAKAASALIEYVNAAEPTDFESTVYYLDFFIRIDISLKDGKVTQVSSEISEEKVQELVDKWYK